MTFVSFRTSEKIQQIFYAPLSGLSIEIAHTSQTSSNNGKKNQIHKYKRESKISSERKEEKKSIKCDASQKLFTRSLKRLFIVHMNIDILFIMLHSQWTFKGRLNNNLRAIFSQQLQKIQSKTWNRFEGEEQKHELLQFIRKVEMIIHHVKE